MSEWSLDDCDVPCVRDLLMHHFQDMHLEVEGKLGRRRHRGNFREKFTSGVNGKQFAALEARLCKGVPLLGLSANDELPELETTLDRFLDCGNRKTIRQSFRCDSAGRPEMEPFEVLQKTRLSDCHVANKRKGRSPSDSPVAIRISFSEEEPTEADVSLRVINQRLKRRRSWESQLFRIQLTRAEMDGCESFEVEVELRMEVVRARLIDESTRADQAKTIGCELSFAMQELAAWAAEVPVGQKRKRLEDFDGALPTLKAVLELPDVARELDRRVSEGPTALHDAKCYLSKVLQDQCPSVDQNVLFRFAGLQVGRVLVRRRSSLASQDADVSSAPALSSKKVV